MRFSGHETFVLREDWLPKGLSLLKADPGAFSDPFVSDHLGVGRNMAKSIRFWLRVTGVTEPEKSTGNFGITSIGKTILDKDPYFARLTTWWALHLNLISNKKFAISWNWFFNRFAHDRFDRTRCLNELHQYLKLAGMVIPSPTTLTRDLLCLTSSYSTPVPPVSTDPEEGIESPFRNLDLVMHYRESDSYQLNRYCKDVSPAMFGYALSGCPAGDSNDSHAYISFSDALMKPGSPGRMLVLNPESFAETVEMAQSALGPELIRIDSSGGERIVRIKQLSRVEWLKLGYRN